MVKSMTGIGNAELHTDSFDYSVRVQSVNHRFLDLNIRLPNSFSVFENEIRSVARNFISRGKVDIYFSIKDLREDSFDITIREPLVNALFNASTSLHRRLGVEQTYGTAQLMGFNGAVNVEQKELDDKETIVGQITSCLETALKEMVAARSAEGERLRSDIIQRIEASSALLDAIEKHAAGVRDEYRKRIHERITEMIEDTRLDEQRLEQEVAYLVDRSDITEEIVRFRSHIVQIRHLLDEDEAIGKKLDFTVQELNREINTIGSKTRLIEVSKAVIDVKSELERIREQIQNIE